MQKAGDILAELGFNEDASDGAKKAFINNLIKAAGAAPVKSIKKDMNDSPVKTAFVSQTVSPKEEKVAEGKLPEQMSFDFFKKGS